MDLIVEVTIFVLAASAIFVFGAAQLNTLCLILAPVALALYNRRR